MIDYTNIMQEVIDIEVRALINIKNNINNCASIAVNSIAKTSGRTIVCGMGKSGIVGKKIAASFASTGTPSFFMHPGEAFHGDLGMVKSEDVFLGISNSGETDEILKLLPFLKENGNYIISMTGNPSSTLAQNSDCHLNTAVPEEACPLQLAPTASTTAALVMGDALMVALMKARDFKAENFARFHPGGSLGRRLLSRVENEMRSKSLPVVHKDNDIVDVISKMSLGGMGLTLVEQSSGEFGLITDGDLRRAFEEKGENAFSLTAGEIATSHPVAISPKASLQAAYELMDKEKINCLIVEDGGKLLGILNK